MIFGETPLEAAEGAILAHSLRLKDRALKKGRVLSADDVAALRAAELSTVVAARLEPGDVAEDEAATRVAAAIAGENLTQSAAFTGRCNLFSRIHGVLVVERARLDELNLLHESITVATLMPFEVVEARQMTATIKVIPFAAPAAVVARCEALADDHGPLIQVAALKPVSAALIQTERPGLKQSILDNTTRSVSGRLESLDSRLADERRCPHEVGAVANRIADMVAAGHGLVMVSGASAIVDRRDVIPAAIEQAGGAVEHFGMPVDPGNLMLMGRVGTVPVLGLPGCARSPSLNGFDWVLRRLVAGLAVSGAEVMAMGAGGLLKEISSRPLPRTAATKPAPDTAAAVQAPRVAALVLAAGQSRRMGRTNKLLAEIDGVPMVARVVDTVLASQADRVVVVTGHQADRVRRALIGRDLAFAHNPDYAAGLSTSLKRGLAALPEGCDAVVVCHGDMPRVTAADIDRLIAAFDPSEGRAVCVPTVRGKRGNPVLWAARFIPEMLELEGDVGAKHLIGQYPDLVAEVAMTDDG
ncbi:MAG: NTP transferase domain-containing protein, partial [Kiloniellales bacterium]